MWQKLSLLIRFVLTFFKLSIVKIFHWRSFSFSGIQFISLATHFRIRNGKISLEGKNMIEPSTLLQVDGGEIRLHRNFINRNCTIVSRNKIDIGDGTTIGPNVCIYDHDHGHGDQEFITAPICIGSNVWIGANSVILKGVTIGNNAIIGAGTVVTRNVADGCTVVGNMMRQIK